jgi:Fe-S-cluster containining protein
LQEFRLKSSYYTTDLSFIASEGEQKEDENDHFLRFIQRQSGAELDEAVHRINKEVSNAVDCTECGNCCSSLMINVKAEEIGPLAEHLKEPESKVLEMYVEESLAGNLFINAIPCHFLKEKKCTVYTHRFAECRDFPHLHKDGFKERLLGTLLHYGRCPIIYNVVEQVKIETGFLVTEGL